MTDNIGSILECRGMYEVTEHNISPDKYLPESLKFERGQRYYIIGLCSESFILTVGCFSESEARSFDFEEYLTCNAN